MLFELSIYLKLAAMAVRSKAQYKIDFLSSIAGIFLFNGLNLAQLAVLTWRFRDIAGWGIWELVFLYSLFMFCRSIYATFFHRIEELEDDIAQGTFDSYLVRPISPLLQLIGRDVQYLGGADLMFAVSGFVLSLSFLRPEWGAMHILWLAIFLISGIIIETAIGIALSSTAFKFVRTSALLSIVMRLKQLTAQYPVSIFGKSFKVLTTAVLPIAFINYYPAIYLLGKTDEPNWLCMLSPVVALALLGLALLAWRQGLKGYSSTGS